MPICYAGEQGVRRNIDMEILAVKDEENELPIPTAWRPTFRYIVNSFANKDYSLSERPREVSPISEDTATQIRDYIEDYGEKLVELPEASWETSVCIWMGNEWDVLIDLWTASEGQSDLVLSAKVAESTDGFNINVYMVYVP